MAKKAIAQVLRYCTVGATAASLQFIIVIFSVQVLKFNPLYANVVGFMCGFVVSLTGNRYWTFAATQHQFSSIIPRYCLSTSLYFILNQSLFYFFLRKLHINYVISLIMAIMIVTSLIFLINKFWVFRS